MSLSRRLRSPSLFWTFTGAFLVVLVLAGLLQAFVVVAVVRPLADRWADDRVRIEAREAAGRIAALFEAPSAAGSVGGPGDRAIQEMLPDPRGEPEHPGERAFLLFRHSDGRSVASRLVARRGRWMERLLADDPEVGAFVIPPRRPRGGPGGERPPPGGPDDPPPGPDGPPRLRVVAREPVIANAVTVGHVMVLRPEARFRIWPASTPRPLLLFLPVAALIAGVAGVVLFRVLTRRLRALENLATRVTDGDLDARVEDPSADEIGRLGERLNRMTERLKEARDRVEASDRQRRQLLGDITHELATPLTSIRGYTEMLLNPDVPLSDDERARYLQDVLGESERMDLLIQDLLELTRLEAGADRLDRERLDWAALCRNTVDRFEHRFHTADLTLRWEGADDPAWVVADGRRLEHVLENLLVNALRYVPPGGEVVVSMTPATGVASGPHRLRVADDGPGIPDEHLPHVFDRFYRADPARAAGGSGLGLAIVKEIVERHGGAVEVENRSPQGATFGVQLPSA